jgi:hypothetical protein
LKQESPLLSRRVALPEGKACPRGAESKSVAIIGGISRPLAWDNYNGKDFMMVQLKRLLFRGSPKSRARLLFLWQIQKPDYQAAVQYFIGTVDKHAAFPKSPLSHA